LLKFSTLHNGRFFSVLSTRITATKKLIFLFEIANTSHWNWQW